MRRSYLPGLAVTVALLLLGACERSSPTAPSPPMQGNVVFVDAAPLAAHHGTITTLLEDTLARANGVMPVGGVQFLVSADRGRTIPGWGMGGYTLGPATVEIVIDPTFDGLEALLPARLPQVAAHELHHAVRWRGPGPYRTLLEALVFEGLADHFAIELLGTPLPPWCMAFPASQVDLYGQRARPELDDFFDFSAWFFGIGTDLPRWTGYTLGYLWVDDYLARHPGTTAAGLVHAPADAFRPPG